MTEPSASEPANELANAKSRCLELHSRLIGSSTPATRTLLRLVESELRFLSRPTSSPLSSNLPHLVAVHHVITHPSIRNVSRVGPTNSCHVDVVCTFRASPAWVLVSARNPAGLSWAPFQARVAGVVDAATLSEPAVRPEKVLVAFASGVGDVIASVLADEFCAVEIEFFGEMDLFEEIEDGWVSVRIGDIEELKKWRVFEITIVEELSYQVGRKVEILRRKNVDVEEEEEGLDLESGFGSLASKLRPDSEELINFDTTALIAVVSGISNGGVKRLMDLPEAETRARFGSNYDFVISQALSEIECPMLLELEKVWVGKRGIICESVKLEFEEIVLMCGGPEEKIRASQLLKRLFVVQDYPSDRMMDLPTTRKLTMKNKIVFGTGDDWRAPTLTANMGFYRAVCQTGMSLLTIEHRPRALIGF